jgi:hypothetical protein
MAIVAGWKELNELEQSEGLFNESDFDASSESDNENDSKLSRSLEDINYELKQRADLSANNRTTYEMNCFIFLVKILLFRNDVETSLRLRQERLKRNEVLGKKVNEMKAKLNAQSSTSNNNQSILTLLMTKYRRPFYIGLFTIFTGSIFFYKFLTSNDRTR